MKGSRKSVKIGDTTITKEQFDELDNMIGGISYKYAGWHGMSRDDFYQEGWCVAIKVLDEVGYEPNLIAHNFYNRITDINRYNRRRENQQPFDPTSYAMASVSESQIKNSPLQTEDSYKPPYEGYWSKKNRLGTDFSSKISIQEMNKLFEDGSKEQRYFQLVSIYIGSVENADALMDKLFKFERSMDVEIAELLEFASSSSSGYRNVKRRVRRAIAKYMGWGENYNHVC